MTFSNKFPTFIELLPKLLWPCHLYSQEKELIVTRIKLQLQSEHLKGVSEIDDMNQPKAQYSGKNIDEKILGLATGGNTLV